MFFVMRLSLLLMINFFITLSKFTWPHSPIDPFIPATLTLPCDEIFHQEEGRPTKDLRKFVNLKRGSNNFCPKSTKYQNVLVTDVLFYSREAWSVERILD